MPDSSVSRRTLLKAIVAGSGGIIASAFLPEKWVKPVVSSGVLPVHAQASVAGVEGGTIQGAVSLNGTQSPGITVSASTEDQGTMISGFRLARPKEGGAPIYTDTTNNNGQYEISNIPPGDYVVWASQPFGYHKGFVTVTSGSSTTVNFHKIIN